MNFPRHSVLLEFKELNFFKSQPRNFIFYTLPLIKSLSINYGEVLFSIGEFVNEMYIVAKGVLSLNLGSVYDNIEIAKIGKGEHIGDVLLYLHEQSPYELRCKSKFPEILVIKESDYFKIKTHFNENILSLLSSSMLKVEIYEHRRLFVIEQRKIEKDPKKIVRKMKEAVNNLNIIDDNSFEQKQNEKFKRDLEEIESYEKIDRLYYLVKKLRESLNPRILDSSNPSTVELN